MKFTASTPADANANERPVDMYVTPEVTADGHLVIRIPLNDVEKHLGVTRDADTGKIKSVGFAVKTNPTFSLLANDLKARNISVAKAAGEKYDESTPLAATITLGSRGLWIGAQISADLTPRGK